MLVLEIFALHQVLNERRFFPEIFQNLVTADMHVRRFRKELDRLVEHVFEKLKCYIRRAKNLFENAPSFLDFVFVISLAPKLRVSCQRRRSVARKLDLRDHVDISRLCVRNNIPYLSLRIKPLNRPPIALKNRRVNALVTLRPLRPYLSQFRILLDLDPPTLIVSQMPVKLVEFVLGQQIDVPLDERNRHKMPRNVEVHPAVFETGTVANLNFGYPTFIL